MYKKRAIPSRDTDKPRNFQCPSCPPNSGFGWLKSKYAPFFPENPDGTKNFDMTRTELLNHIVEQIHGGDASKKERTKISTALTNMKNSFTKHFQNGISGCTRKFPLAFVPQKNGGGKK